MELGQLTLSGLRRVTSTVLHRLLQLAITEIFEVSITTIPIL